MSYTTALNELSVLFDKYHIPPKPIPFWKEVEDILFALVERNIDLHESKINQDNE